MQAGSGRSGDPSATVPKADPAAGSPRAENRLVTWHGDLVAWLDELGWLRTVNDWLAAVLGRSASGTRTI